MKHPNLLDGLACDIPRFEQKAHVGGLVGVGFAGAGGSSLGLKWAGLDIDFAMNHDAAAIAMHSANCPEAHHYCQDIWQVRPETVRPGEPIRFMWFSPDCTHFSKAKGGAPVEKKIRDLAWVIVLWAKLRRPDVIAMENVEEFVTWGPLIDKADLALRDDPNFFDPAAPVREAMVKSGEVVPDPARKGEYFEAFKAEFRKLGYYYGFKQIRAFRHGTPTIRNRLFGQFRCDGEPITWPEPEYGDPNDPDVISGKLKPWRTIAECIEWERPCPSIFMTRQETTALRRAGGPRANRPLKDPTMARITLGLQRFVLEAKRPFYVPITHAGPPRAYSVDAPGMTQTCANRGEHALIVPHLSTMRNAHKPFNGADEPGVTDTAGGANRAVVAAHITEFHGGQDRGRAMNEPGPTMTSNSYQVRPGGAAPVGLVEAFLSGCGGRRGQSPPVPITSPFPTGTTKPDEIIVAATMIQTGYGEREGQEPRAIDIQTPVGVQVAGGAKHAPVAVYMAQQNGGNDGHPADEPLSTLLTAGCHQNLAAAQLTHLRGSGERFGNSIEEPGPTDTAGGWHLAVSSFCLVKYYSAAEHGQPASEPLHAITTKARFGLVKVDLSSTGLTEEQRYTAYWVARMIDVYGYADGLPAKGSRNRKGVGSLCRRSLQEQIDRELTPRPSAVGRDGYIVWDIGMRMLSVRERYRAQGVPDDFIIDVKVDGELITATKQGEMCGNMVCPQVSEAIARAALPELREPRQEQRAA